MSEEKKDYGKTLNLPKTSFQMRANLAGKEPQMLNVWRKQNIYEKSLKEGAKQFILHDGPPYANGDIHIGHALNKILKDIILKYKRLQGFDAPYVPGWDTHGLPIEFKVAEELGDKIKDMHPLKIREKCTKYAKKWVEKQKEGFKRLGILGEWDNPYLTLNPEYEAEQLEVFKELYENGYIFKGLKPIHWSPVSKTALAEAEIEYHNHKSPTMFLKMEANPDALEAMDVEEASFVIWTTTPWTIPANMAICLNEKFDYGIYKTSKGNLILAEGLAEKALADMGIEGAELIKKFKGGELEKLTYKHPFLDRTGLIILGDHVTLEAGTGCVHTAPGHGQDDYVVATRYGIEVICPVDQDGHLTDEAGERFSGMFYQKANKAILAYMEETGHLLHTEVIEHSYPHDWRSKTPVIFRATEQWFVKIEGSDVREKALKALEDVEFLPAWGRNRLTTMMENRPDWCISRQRTWGVHIPIFYNNKTGEEIFNSEIADKVIALVKKEGSAAWVKYSAEELIGEELLEKYNLKDIELRKETNIMDVWFDSGVSHRSVLNTRDYLRRPADLYLEGSDQHRGWFQTSLLTSIGSTGDAPYKTILTHGFVNDKDGKKMSKSVGNTVDPMDIINTYGADILRLWCASVDYSDDVRISDNAIKQISESYRRVRNTARYILGNTNDFDPATDKVAYEDLTEIDKWALHRLETLKTNVTANYDKYEFYNLFNDIHYFAGIEMSAFYLDIIKDRLYVEKTDSVARRSAQTVMHEVLAAMTKMISPVLSFTAEEIWGKLPEAAKDTDSVLLTSWYEANPEWINEELGTKWDEISKLRKEVNKVLEKARQGENKIIGNALDAKLELHIADEKLKAFVESNKELLEMVFLVSQFDIVNEEAEEFTKAEEIEGLSLRVSHAAGEKCERCWKYSESLGTDTEYSDICPRCTDVMTK
ncbi:MULTISPECIES: isoleucine--tRNA ligase [Psychrilyobacter]|uniref:Isoleucine--tRNA ligase n=1 Tax=Psychrilyobacter piezotolerans TaxID=2293438 RepID=A0ABX9KKP4_9FUSO|nr:MULTISPECIES: isoleucine--tRNA ligase [Psychrilyobacter]MCS5421630.1 isoleucine--tRNA ligase [Psychrilyobacter sp. S5]NDI76675.1 isoleucine--tRNA ligase [Psychrilyobacter piezotolerans]RDE65299.1 isoleucine--tRNA ligase [Psychrilyobacter sp. S5]REI42917.1 isoleucine--tRNA ligase [Psychrilyobacter piezotolerans]